MTQYLPPNLLALFAARDPIPYLPPVDKPTHLKKTDGYSGVAQLMSRFEDPKDTPPPRHVETRDERMERKRREKAEQIQYKLEQEIALWDPHNNSEATSDPYKSLFVARINYDTSESKLRREFEVYGPIKKIRMVTNVIDGKPRGYAFIEYEHERDMHAAYKNADGKKIDNRRVLVDVERARTVKGWLSRRLGGGLGGTRRGGPDVNIKHSGREDDRKRGTHEDSRDRAISRDKERRKSRSRDRTKERDRDRRRRSRSRDRKRRRSRDRHAPEVTIDDEERIHSRRHRSRSPRDKDRKHKRSRSRERKHRRDRDRERSSKMVSGDNGSQQVGDQSNVKIKQEPEDDYPEYPGANPVYDNIPLKDEDGRPRNGTKMEDDEGNNEIDY